MELTKRKMSWNRKAVLHPKLARHGGVGVQKYSNHHAGNIHMDFHLWRGGGKKSHTNTNTVDATCNGEVMHNTEAMETSKIKGQGSRSQDVVSVGFERGVSVVGIGKMIWGSPPTWTVDAGTVAGTDKTGLIRQVQKDNDSWLRTVSTERDIEWWRWPTLYGKYLTWGDTYADTWWWLAL